MKTNSRKNSPETKVCKTRKKCKSRQTTNRKKKIARELKHPDLQKIEKKKFFANFFFIHFFFFFATFFFARKYDEGLMLTDRWGVMLMSRKMKEIIIIKAKMIQHFFV